MANCADTKVRYNLVTDAPDASVDTSDCPSKMAKIIVVDDDAALTNIIVDWLQNENYTVESVAKGTEALEFLDTYPYDLVILDWGLPDLSGIEVCKKYRAKGGRAPVLMLTGKDHITEKEEGLDAGADDYLTKPFEVRELSARIRALLRRPPSWHDNVVKIGPLELDPSTRTVNRNGAELQIFPRDFALLEFLMRHAGKVFTSDALMN
ncbi:MAG: response regulator transcription factor, partial [Terriglobales bacterium]